MILSRLFVVSLLLSCVTGGDHPLKEHGALRGTHMKEGETEDALAHSKDGSSNPIMSDASVNVKDTERGLMWWGRPPPTLPWPVNYPPPTTIQASKPIIGIVRPKNGKKVNIWETFTVKVNAYDMHGSIPDSYVWWYVDGYRQVATGKVARIRADILGEGYYRPLSVLAYNPTTQQYSDYAYAWVTVAGYSGHNAQQMNDLAQPAYSSPSRHRGGNRAGDIFLP